MAVKLRIMIILLGFSVIFIGASFFKNVDSKFVYPAIISITLEMITKLFYLSDQSKSLHHKHRSYIMKNKQEQIFEDHYNKGMSILYIVTILCYIMILNTFYSNIKGNKIITFCIFNYMIYAVFQYVGLNTENKDCSWMQILFWFAASNIFKVYFLHIWDNINSLYF